MGHFQLATRCILITVPALWLVGCGPKDYAKKIHDPTMEDIVIPKAAVDENRLAAATLDRLKEATVLIGNFEGGSLKATGSGFVVGDGKRILTNKHVATGTDDRPDDLKLVFWSGTEKARVVNVPVSGIRLYGSLPRKDDKYHHEDLAVLSIGAKVAEPLEVAGATSLSETMPVWGLGFPGGTDILSTKDMPNPTVHSMRVERLEKAKDLVTMIQLSGSQTHGNSGGPVVDHEGKVVGVLTAKLSGAPIVFAIPAVRAEKFLAGSTGGAKSIAQLWREPLKKPASAPSSSTSSGGRSLGPIQNYSSALNQGDLSYSDLEDLTAVQLTLLRNEPFARRGYIFNRSDLRRVFRATGWYQERTKNLSAVQRLLTRRESRNIDLVKAYQKSSGKDY